MKSMLLSLFKRLSRVLSGSGVGRLPFAVTVHDLLFKRLVPKGIHRYRVGNNYMWVDSEDAGVGRFIIKENIFAPEETSALKRVLKPGMTFVDIGANIGYFTLIGAERVGQSGRVFAFEPDSSNFALLERNVEENNYSNIVSVNKAVGKESGSGTLYLDPLNSARHTLIKHDAFSAISTPVVSLDDYFAVGERIDVVKIDVEGAEPLVLDGMKRTLRTNAAVALIVEFYPAALRDAGHNPATFLRSLFEFGFALYGIEGALMPKEISEEEIELFAKGNGFRKLINILAVKGVM